MISTAMLLREPVHTQLIGRALDRLVCMCGQRCRCYEALANCILFQLTHPASSRWKRVHMLGEY